jgi:hypothetical protein
MLTPLFLDVVNFPTLNNLTARLLQEHGHGASGIHVFTQTQHVFFGA